MKHSVGDSWKFFSRNFSTQSILFEYCEWKYGNLCRTSSFRMRRDDQFSRLCPCPAAPAPDRLCNISLGVCHSFVVHVGVFSSLCSLGPAHASGQPYSQLVVCLYACNVQIAPISSSCPSCPARRVLPILPILLRPRKHRRETSLSCLWHTGHPVPTPCPVECPTHELHTLCTPTHRTCSLSHNQTSQPPASPTRANEPGNDDDKQPNTRPL